MADVNQKFVSLIMNKYDDKLEDYFRQIKVSSDYNALVSLMSDVYKTIKEAGLELYDCASFDFFYGVLKATVLKCEREVEDKFIIESNPSFNFVDDRFIDSDIFNLEDEDLLDYLVWFVRTRLYEKNRTAFNRDIDINELSFMNDCSFASNIIKMMCSRLGVNCRLVKIEPAYTDKVLLYDGNGFHFFCLVDLFDKQYIVDTTYRQFFKLNNNVIERLGVYGLNGCAPGVYMLENESRKNTAINLLKRGWIEADSENLKNYLDGFTLSFRNGLYYEGQENKDFTVSYSCDDYYDFLNGFDSQVNYEDLECLGEQRKMFR